MKKKPANKKLQNQQNSVYFVHSELSFAELCFPGFQKHPLCLFAQHFSLLGVYDDNFLGWAYTTSCRRLLYTKGRRCRLVSCNFSFLRDPTRELLLGYGSIYLAVT